MNVTHKRHKPSYINHPKSRINEKNSIHLTHLHTHIIWNVVCTSTLSMITASDILHLKKNIHIFCTELLINKIYHDT